MFQKINWPLANGLTGLATLTILGCQSQPVQTAQDQEVVGQITIEMRDMSYAPNTQDVPREGRYKLKVFNTSHVAHDIVFDNGVSLKAGPGASAETELVISNNGLAYRCSLPGHEQAGMVGMITVNDQAAESMRKHVPEPDTNLQPEYVSPIAPELLPGKIHEIELVAQEKDMAIAKDAVQNLWTYNGQVQARRSMSKSETRYGCI